MTHVKALFITIIASLTLMTPAVAGDFDWLDNLNIKAQADSSGFRMQVASRFNIGSAEVRAVIGNVDSPSDAYMVFRLGELSHKPIQEVLHVYSTSKNRGWGVMARQLGIKPGSQEFHALKRGHDLYAKDNGGSPMVANKGNGKHKGKPNKHKGKK